MIACTSSSSNPTSVLSWWKDGNEIEGIDGGVIGAENGGTSTISKLQLRPTAEDDGEIYACRATNPLLETAVSDAVTLDVLCESLTHLSSLSSFQFRLQSMSDVNEYVVFVYLHRPHPSVRSSSVARACSTFTLKYLPSTNTQCWHI